MRSSTEKATGTAEPIWSPWYCCLPLLPLEPCDAASTVRIMRQFGVPRAVVPGVDTDPEFEVLAAASRAWVDAHWAVVGRHFGRSQLGPKRCFDVLRATDYPGGLGQSRPWANGRVMSDRNFMRLCEKVFPVLELELARRWYAREHGVVSARGKKLYQDWGIDVMRWFGSGMQRFFFCAFHPDGRSELGGAPGGKLGRKRLLPDEQFTLPALKREATPGRVERDAAGSDGE